jgi:hypothetical protein
MKGGKITLKEAKWLLNSFYKAFIANDEFKVDPSISLTGKIETLENYENLLDQPCSSQSSQEILASNQISMSESKN